MYDWHEKTVFITGASSGIGAELGRDLAKRGAIVGLLARRLENLQILQTQINQNGGRADIFAADVTDAEAVQKAFDEFLKIYQKIDVLVANAGIGGGTMHASELDIKRFRRTVDVNLMGAVHSVAAVLPSMLARKSGHLVAVSSLAGYGGLPKSASYCASKAALSTFFESLRIDLHDSGVDVTIINPGFIKTPLTAGREAAMPCLMELSDGVEAIRRGIESRRRIVAFPFPLAHFVRLARFFPAALYDYIARRASFRE